MNAIGTEDEWAKALTTAQQWAKTLEESKQKLKDILDDLESLDEISVYYDRRWAKVRTYHSRNAEEDRYIRVEDLQEIIKNYRT